MLSDNRTVERHHRASQSGTAVDDNLTNLQNSILERMGLIGRTDRGIVFDGDHVRIYNLGKSIGQGDPLADLHSHSTKVWNQDEGSFESFQNRCGPLSPRHVEEVPTAAPTGPERMNAFLHASQQSPFEGEHGSAE